MLGAFGLVLGRRAVTKQANSPPVKPQMASAGNGKLRLCGLTRTKLRPAFRCLQSPFRVGNFTPSFCALAFHPATRSPTATPVFAERSVSCLPISSACLKWSKPALAVGADAVGPEVHEGEVLASFAMCLDELVGALLCVADVPAFGTGVDAEIDDFHLR